MQPARYRGIGAPKSVKERLAQVTWLLAYLDDIASDLSAIHGIRDMTCLSGPVFCKLAMRLTAYQSVMQARVTALVNDSGQQPAASASGQQGQRQMVPATKAALQSDEVMSGLFSFGSMT